MLIRKSIWILPDNDNALYPVDFSNKTIGTYCGKLYKADAILDTDIGSGNMSIGAGQRGLKGYPIKAKIMRKGLGIVPYTASDWALASGTYTAATYAPHSAIYIKKPTNLTVYNPGEVNTTETTDLTTALWTISVTVGGSSWETVNYGIRIQDDADSSIVYTKTAEVLPSEVISASVAYTDLTTSKTPVKGDTWSIYLCFDTTASTPVYSLVSSGHYYTETATAITGTMQTSVSASEITITAPSSSVFDSYYLTTNIPCWSVSNMTPTDYGAYGYIEFISELYTAEKTAATYLDYQPWELSN
jgi:hypothetical protein